MLTPFGLIVNGNNNNGLATHIGTVPTFKIILKFVNIWNIVTRPLKGNGKVAWMDRWLLCRFFFKDSPKNPETLKSQNTKVRKYQNSGTLKFRNTNPELPKSRITEIPTYLKSRTTEIIKVPKHQNPDILKSQNAQISN